MSTERVHLFVIGNTLCFTHQSNLLSFSLTGLENVMSFALTFSLSLFGALAGDLHTHCGGHEIFLIIGL